MKKLIGAAVCAVVLLNAGSTFAEEATVKLALKGVDCPSCFYIIRESLANVDGVLNVEIASWEQSATVTYDDTITDIAALTAATGNAGFPSEPFGQGS